VLQQASQVSLVFLVFQDILEEMVCLDHLVLLVRKEILGGLGKQEM
jgi:hypothetical protein